MDYYKKRLLTKSNNLTSIRYCDKLLLKRYFGGIPFK